jgi:hypothetical protein
MMRMHEVKEVFYHQRDQQIGDMKKYSDEGADDNLLQNVRRIRTNKDIRAKKGQSFHLFIRIF